MFCAIYLSNESMKTRSDIVLKEFVRLCKVLVVLRVLAQKLFADACALHSVE